MDERERLRAKMIENAAEINCLHRRIHETVKRRGESEELRQEWSELVRSFMQIMPSSVFLEDGTLAFSTASWRAIHRRLKSPCAFSRSAPIFSAQGTTGKPFCRNANGRH